MLLGYNTWSMPQMPIDQTVDLLARTGYDSLELTICTGWTTDAALMTAADRRRIRSLIKDSGLVLTGCSGNMPVLASADEWREGRNQLLTYLDFAADIQGDDARRLYVSTTSGPMPAGQNWEGCRALLAERMSDVAAAAEARGVSLHLEPHVLMAASRPEQALWLLREVASPALRLTLDISHFEVQGDDYRAVVKELVPFAGGVEVKDETGINPDFQFLIPGEGDMDYPGFLACLDASGYKGSVSVEISKFRQVVGYDAADAAIQSYKVLASAFEQAGVSRGR